MRTAIQNALLLMCLLPALQGCFVYYAQSLGGHIEILNARQSVDELRADPETPDTLRAQMEVAADIRRFASEVLHLPDNKSYKSYVDLERDYVTIAIFAAPEFSLVPVKHCFPLFGCVPYQGHFSRKAARSQLEKLRAQGLDVHVSGVTAYSTLGWTPDPLLNTMFQAGDTRAAAVVFHELAHQQLYFRGDTAFNEAFAVAVEIEGVKAWLRARGDRDGARRYEQSLERHADFLTLIDRTRAELWEIYRSPEPDKVKRAAKALSIDTLRRRYRALRDTQWGGFDGYDGWFDGPINNAKLAVSGIYNDLVPEFRALFDLCGRDFPRFYTAVQSLSGQTADARRMALQDARNCFY